MARSELVDKRCTIARGESVNMCSACQPCVRGRPTTNVQSSRPPPQPSYLLVQSIRLLQSCLLLFVSVFFPLFSGSVPLLCALSWLDVSLWPTLLPFVSRVSCLASSIMSTTFPHRCRPSNQCEMHKPSRAALCVLFSFFGLDRFQYKSQTTSAFHLETVVPSTLTTLTEASRRCIVLH